MTKEEIILEMKKKISKSLDALNHEFAGLRTGRASVAILDHVKVEYYGNLTPLSQVATLSVPESRTITIQPWDPSQIHPIEKAILASGLGLTPSNDGKVIRINIPQLTSERRKELIKVAKKYTEDCKVSIRNIRRDANEDAKKLEKDKGISQDDLKKIQHEIQDITDKHVAKADELLARKEAEIMEV